MLYDIIMKEEIINSKQNNKIKLLKKLTFKKYRYQMHKFMVENLTIIYDALVSNYYFESLFVTKEFINKHKEKFNYLLKNSKITKYYLINKKINKHYSKLDTPSEITAIYKMKLSALKPKKSIIYLNNISDPNNLGAIMRNCLAFNFVNIIIDNKCVDIYNYKTINAAKDSIFKLNIMSDKNNKWIKENKNILPIYITSSHQGINLKEFKPTKNFCLVFGNESHGVSDEIIKLSKNKIKIEISKNVESLNVASSTAILLYILSNNQNI